MHFLLTLGLVVAVHLALHAETWSRVGLLADDRHMVGAAVLRHQGTWSFASMFLHEGQANAAVALYRPFLDLLFWLEQPFFGTDAFGYHVVNSAMHCATAMVWFVLVRRWTGSAAAGLATALLFVGWPGHSEALHWIAARTNVQSTFCMSLALFALDVGMLAATTNARLGWAALAACAATVAVGTKESAVFVVPLAGILGWWRASPPQFGRRVGCALQGTAPMVVAVAAWLAWRARMLGTWGSGSRYGWHGERVSLATCADWLAVLVAPVHRTFHAAAWVPVLAVLHGGLLVVALTAWRQPAARLPVLVGATLLAMGYVAGIGLEHLDLATLENVRYSYEPALGLCVLSGVAVAALPSRVRGPLLALLVGVHAFVLDGNRQSWLQAADVYRRMEQDIVDVARATQQPIRVLQAPGVRDGAFALLNGYTEFLFMQATAPPGTDLRGGVASTQEWAAVLHELAAAAAQGKASANTFTVQWNDGALAAYTIDGQWPREPWPGLRIGYAWVARSRPFVGSDVPVHVLVTSDQPIRLFARARSGDRSWSGPERLLSAGSVGEAVDLSLPLPADLVAGASVEVDLVVRGTGGEREHISRFGSTWPTTR